MALTSFTKAGFAVSPVATEVNDTNVRRDTAGIEMGFRGGSLDATVGVEELLPNNSGVTLHGPILTSLIAPDHPSADSQTFPGSNALASPLIVDLCTIRLCSG